MKIFFPMHVGSGNRGCEGIIRGTYKILETLSPTFYLLDKDEDDKELDKKLAVDKIGELSKRKVNSLFVKTMNKIGFYKKQWNINPYYDFLNLADSESVVMFSGGDLYCYKETIETNYYVLDYLNKKHVKSILWGASIDVSLLSDDVINQMNSFKAIICR